MNKTSYKIIESKNETDFLHELRLHTEKGCKVIGYSKTETFLDVQYSALISYEKAET